MKIRTINVVVVLLAIMLAGCGASTDSGTVGDIGRFLDNFGKAMETGDPERVAALHEYPVKIIDIDGESEHADKEQIRTLYALSLAFIGEGATVVVDDYDATTAGNTATVEVIYNVDSPNFGTYQSEFLWVIKWNGSAWRIIEHHMID